VTATVVTLTLCTSDALADTDAADVDWTPDVGEVLRRPVEATSEGVVGDCISDSGGPSAHGLKECLSYPTTVDLLRWNPVWRTCFDNEAILR